MKQRLTRDKLQKILRNQTLDSISLERLVELVRAEPEPAKYEPDGICQTDPRSGDRVVYNSARTQRPHDNRPDEPASSGGGTSAEPCVVCEGRTTGVIDVAELSEGFTFINENLFPVLYPAASFPNTDNYDAGPLGVSAIGLHLLQWTSSLHDRDWENMPLSDLVIVMQRLAALEEKLLMGSTTRLPAQGSGLPARFVSIIKNVGHLVGGSLAHGHQQIGLSNVMPRRVRDNWQFSETRGQFFTAHMLDENPEKLLLRDYGAAVLVIPYFMRRPFEMMLMLKDVTKQYVHELSRTELMAVACGWQDAIRVILTIMPQQGRQTAYNVVSNTGPGTGLYFEFLPYMQETGGFEQLGLYVCQANPLDAANQVRGLLAGFEENLSG